MLYTSDKTVKYSSKLGVERLYYYQNDCCQSKNIKLKFCISACIVILISVLILTTVYYFNTKTSKSNSNYNHTLENLPILNPNDLDNFETSDQNETEEIIIENLNISSGEMPTALPFLSSWLSPFTDPEPIYETKIVRHRSEKIPRPFLHDIQDHRPNSHYGPNNAIHRNINQQAGYPKANNVHDIFHYLEDSHSYDKNSDTDKNSEGVKFRGTFHHPLPDMYSSASSNNGRKVNTYPKIPIHMMDPFYRYKPQNPGEINLLAPNNYRFSLPSYQKYGHRSRYPLYEGETDHLHPRNHMKPLSVMLDIYPMTNGKNQEMDTSSTIHAINKPLIQTVLPVNDQYYNLKHQNLIETQQETNSVPYPYYKSTKVTNDDISTDQNEHVIKEAQSPNKMVVHLNLYPRKRHRSSAVNTKNKTHLNHNKPNLMTEAFYKKNNDYILQNENYNTQEYSDYPGMEISPRYNKRKYIQERKYITQHVSDEELNAVVTEAIGLNFVKNNSDEYLNPSDLNVQELQNQTEDSISESLEENKIHLHLNNSFLNVYLNGNPSDNNLVLQTENKTGTYFQKMLKSKNINVPDYTFSTPPQVTHSKYATAVPAQLMHWDLNKLLTNPSLVDQMNDQISKNTSEKEDIE